jgi:chromatin segregation and condensation protein Rec8/ScpA/Scc1 (kleisin family)
VRIADRLAGIGAMLRASGRVRFVDVLTDGPRTREFVVVSFLAVLEMLRRAAILVRQDELFGEIVVETRSEEALEAVLSSGTTFLDED